MISGKPLWATTLGLLCLFLLTCSLGPMHCAVAEEPATLTQEEKTKKELPPGLKEYLGRRIAPTMAAAHADWLTRKERDREEDTTAMHKALNLKPGMMVCDLGAGNGYHTLKMSAEILPKGKVYAVDIQQEMLDKLKLRAKGRGRDNIELVLGSLVDVNLPKASVDLILLVDVYHEFSHPVQMLSSMRKSLKANGQIVLVEFREEDPKVPIRPLHKMSKKQVIKEMNANGFKLVREYDKLPWQHMMFFGIANDKKPKK